LPVWRRWESPGAWRCRRGPRRLRGTARAARGDARTPAGATAGVKTYLAPACSSRTYVATPYPGKVVVGAETNGIYQMGAVVLRRGDLTLGGPAGDVADVDVMLTDVELDGVAAAFDSSMSTFLSQYVENDFPSTRKIGGTSNGGTDFCYNLISFLADVRFGLRDCLAR